MKTKKQIKIIFNTETEAGEDEIKNVVVKSLKDGLNYNGIAKEKLITITNSNVHIIDLK